MRPAFISSILLAAAVSLSAASPSALGPPGICNRIEVGGTAATLDAAWKGVDKGNLSEKLPGVLDQFPGSTVSRMEALRRAVFVDTALGDNVVGALALRALEQEAAQAPTAAAAIFDAGYAIHLYKTLGVDTLQKRAVKDGVAGYAFVSRAIELGGDAGMHVGAAYMTLPAMQSGESQRLAARNLFRSHCESALKSCAAGSPEETNLKFVLGIEGESLESVRDRARVAGR